ncbi:hypothetical protein GCM10017772_11670 [Promicromonospora soli]|uniref:Uncharacterized protein n=1 Tax=Promicromonospora soli TaxID=2035533 RepID=A0A919KQG3_9MICO|nr:hypothetical protein GCM10017772_11670 [Promicromonospora soli]
MDAEGVLQPQCAHGGRLSWRRKLEAGAASSGFRRLLLRRPDVVFRPGETSTGRPARVEAPKSGPGPFTYLIYKDVNRHVDLKS